MIRDIFRLRNITIVIVLYVSALMFVPSDSIAQQEIITTEQQEINNLLSYSAQVFESNPDSAISMIDQGLKKSREMASEESIFDLLMQRGIYLSSLGFYDSAFVYLSQARYCLKYPQNKHKTYLLYANLGLCYCCLGKYEQALNCFDTALQDTNTDSAGILLNRGGLWYTAGEHSQALDDWEKAIEIAKRKNSPAQIIRALLNIAAIKSTGNPEEAEQLFHEAITLAAKYQIPRYRFIAFMGIAELLRGKGQYRQALAYLTDSLPDIARYRTSSREWLSMRMETGNIYQASKQYEKALEVLTEVYNGASKYKHTDILLKSIPAYAAACAALGKHNKAYELMLEETVLKDSVFQKEKLGLLKAWVYAQIKNKDNALLRQRYQLLQQQNQSKSRNLWTLFAASGVIVVILAMSLLIFSYRQKNKRQQNQIVYLKQKQEIIQLKAQVRGEEEERNRIASELHNNIAGQLWAVKMGVNMLQEEDNIDILQRKLIGIHGQLTGIAVDLRNTAHNMFPALLLEKGLATAIASLCETIKKNTGLNADFLEYGTPAEMDPEIALSLYRVVQELVQNIVKHANGATGFIVQLTTNGSILNITVEDDGIGFIASELENGMGILNIKNKIKTMKGYIDFKSEVGTGTTVYLELDLLQLVQV